MSFVMAGIKEAYYSKGNAPWPADYTGEGLDAIYGLGIRNAGSFNIEHHNEIEDMRTRKFPQMLNFRAEMNTMQITVEKLRALIGYAKQSSVATAILTSGVLESGGIITSPTGGIYLFDQDNSLGLEFTLNFTDSERIINVVFERAFKYEEGRTLINAAQTAGVPFGVDKTPMINKDDVIAGFVSPSFIPAALETAFGDADLVSFAMNIQTKQTKNAFNKSLVSAITVELEAVTSGPDVPAIHESVKHEFPTDITLQLRSGETIVLKADGITRMGSAMIGDEERQATLTFNGEYDIDYADVASPSAITLHTYLQASS